MIGNPLLSPIFGGRASARWGSNNQLRLPRQYRLFYSRFPNTEDIVWSDETILDDDMYYGGWKLPATVTDWTGATRDMFAILGKGLFFDGSGTPLTVTGESLLGWSGINRWQILFSLKSGLAIYDQAAPVNIIRKAHRVYRAAYEDLGSSGYELFYSSADGYLARKGAVSWDGTPTISADGVTPGHGPSFSDVIAWNDGATLYVKMKMLKSSTGITGDEQVFGPLYVRNGFLVAKDAAAGEAVVAASWAVGGVLMALVQVSELSEMRVVVGDSFGLWALFNGIFPVLSLSSSSPASLLEVKIESYISTVYEQVFVDGEPLKINGVQLMVG